MNNRPQPGESHLQLYHQTKVDTLDYSPVEDLAVEGQPLENAVWTYYLETMGLPADTPREAATIDAVGWENDYTVAISVAVAPLADNDQVPPPWTCTFNIDTKEISASEETTQAVALQDTQPNVTGETAVTGSGAPGDNPLTGEFPGERFPATRLRPLEENEVSSWTGTNIRYAINELYARRGYDFSDNAEVRRQFARMSWYHPLGGSMEDIEKGFSGVEKHNVDLLAKFRPAKQTVRREGRAPRTQQSATPGPGQQFLRALRDGFGPPPRP